MQDTFENFIWEMAAILSRFFHVHIVLWGMPSSFTSKFGVRFILSDHTQTQIIKADIMVAWQYHMES